MLKRMICFFLGLALISGAQAATSDSVMVEHGTATLMSAVEGIVAGEKFDGALRVDLTDGWHTYWENPGDAGLPVSIEWTLPKGFEASPLQWPVPVRMPEQELMTFGYKDRVTLPFSITAAPELNSNGTYILIAKASWLACKEICVPQEAEMSLAIPVGEAAASAQADLVRAAVTSIPKPAAGASYYVRENRLNIVLAEDMVRTKANKPAVFFYPRLPSLIKNNAEPKLERTKTGWLYSIDAAPDAEWPKSISGLMVSKMEGRTLALDVDAPRTRAPFSLSIDGVKDVAGWLWLALLGGLILNLMPCVFPVLSLKAMTLATTSGKDHSALRREGLAYMAGILVSFAVLGGILLGLKFSGEAIGWGFQLQVPSFVAMMALLLLFIGLNLSGFFDLPGFSFTVHMGGEAKHSTGESFRTGILATLVATPCTAPFMATAVGAAFTQPAWIAMLIFLSVGFGLSLPFVVLSLFPRLSAWLPRPGAWMETLRELLAFPMYLSAIWLLWVLGRQVGADGAILTLLAGVVLAFVVWARRWFAGESKTYLALLLFSVLIIGSALGMSLRSAPPAEHANALAFDAVKLEALRKEGTPVYVDATAAWCITCQVNKRVALETRAVRAAFEQRGIVLMVADWTQRDQAITEYLASFGYSGVPLNVYYPPKGEPVVLPQLLTPSVVLDVIHSNP